MEFDYNGNKVVSKFEKDDLVCRYWLNYTPCVVIARVYFVKISIVENKVSIEYDLEPEGYFYLHNQKYSLITDKNKLKYLGLRGSYSKEQDLFNVEDGIYSLVEELEKKKEFLSKLSESLSQQEMGRK